MDAESTVRKGYQCAWQIHYHVVFPVKYRKSLLDEQVVQIIKETLNQKAPLGGEFWTDGYYVATVGERADWKTVERYVQKQGLPKTRHQTVTAF